MKITNDLDWTYYDTGLALVLYPISDRAVTWASAHLPKSKMWKGGHPVEREFFARVRLGIELAGMVIRQEFDGGVG